jgi:hypothetical protein
LLHALELMRENRTGLHLEPLVLTSLAEAEIAAGDISAAERTAREALRIANEVIPESALGVGARTILTRARRLGGEHGLRAEESELRRALRILDATGYRSLEPDVRMELAELAKLRGAGTEFERESRRAHKLLEDMGAGRSDVGVPPVGETTA